MSFLARLTRLNLRSRITVPIVAMVVISMVVISAYLIVNQSDSFFREVESSGETMLRITADNAESGVLFESRYELEDLLKSVSRFDLVVYAIITDAEGNILSQVGTKRVDTTKIVRTLAHKRVKELFDNDAHFGAYFKDSSDREILVLRAPIITQRQAFGRETLGITGGIDQTVAHGTVEEQIGVLELGLTTEHVHRAVNGAKAAAIFLTVLVVLITVVVLTYIIGAIVKPLRELVTVTDQISRGDFSHKVGLIRSDEIGHLAVTFNKMIQSLKQSREEIEQYNRTLEEKIIERTKQLEDAQAQLIQSEKLSAIGQLAAGVAHELNNPLGGILGYAQFTLEKLQKTDSDQVGSREFESYKRYLRDIETQARRCKTIVQNLLRFSRSSRTVDFDEVDINKAIEETVTFVEHQLHLNQVSLSLELSSDLPIIQGNVGQLQQVFTNLIINGMHASEAGATITLRSRFSPALGEFGGAVEVIVSDQGCGIKEENIKRIFEPFFTTKEVGTGTGLGLSVSYGIVKEHGGEISVSSKPGRGTVFTVILPVQKPVPESDKVKEDRFK